MDGTNLTSFLLLESLPGGAKKERNPATLSNPLPDEPSTPTSPQTSDSKSESDARLPSARASKPKVIKEPKALARTTVKKTTRTRTPSFLPKSARPTPNLKSVSIPGPLFEPPTEPLQPAPAPAPAFESPVIVPPTALELQATHAQLQKALLELKSRIVEEIRSRPQPILGLDRARRFSILKQLEALVQSPSTPWNSRPGDEQQLEEWVLDPRTAERKEALEIFFEEIASFYLAQALVLESWTLRGQLTVEPRDLVNPSHLLNRVLQPLQPVQAEGWAFAQPNKYSWFRASETTALAVRNTVLEFSLESENNHTILEVFRSLRPSRTGLIDRVPFDDRFYRALWKGLSDLGLYPSPRQSSLPGRVRYAFTPTLRDGGFIRHCNEPVQWLAAERDALQLYLAQLAYLFEKPLPPPLWGHGLGIEARTHDQMNLGLASPGSNPLLSLRTQNLAKIAEIDACELAAVFEERTVKHTGRSALSSDLREMIDRYFKELKGQPLTLGLLQACVAVSKLRQDGILVLVRNEPLTGKDYPQVVRYLLNRAELIGIWNFSRLEHPLPDSPQPLAPYVYLFRRELDLEKRSNHHPAIVEITGTLRGQVELNELLHEAFVAITPGKNAPRGEARVRVHISPSNQNEWIERWPEGHAQEAHERMDRLRDHSIVLGQLATISPWDKSKALNVESHSQLFAPKLGPTSKGPVGLPALWVSTEPPPGVHSPSPLWVESVSDAPVAPAQGFTIVLPSLHWLAPIRSYLRSRWVKDWLHTSVESRSGKYVLKESAIKMLPVSKTLVNALRNGHELFVKHPEWEKLASELLYKPEEVASQVRKIGSSVLGTLIYARAAEALLSFERENRRLMDLVTLDGKPKWGLLVRMLPRDEAIPFPLLTEQVRVLGRLPPHTPIVQIEPFEAAMPSVRLTIEGGVHTQVAFTSSRLREVFLDQALAHPHPTWSELTEAVFLPRQLERLAETGKDLLRLHAEQLSQRSKIIDLLGDCPLV